MNDCIICAIGKCDGSGCGDCQRYISMNSADGNNLLVEYEGEIQEAVEEIATKFYNKHFGGKDNEQN